MKALNNVKSNEDEDTVCKYQQPVKWMPILMYHRVVDSFAIVLGISHVQ